MNDLSHASTLFIIFALAVVLYGALIAKTGDKDLLPYRAQHSVHNVQDVIRVGLVSIGVGLVIGLIALLTFAFSHLS